MAFLDENCTLDVLTADILAECQPFECGDKDMDEFFIALHLLSYGKIVLLSDE